jgi:alanine racemase
MRIPVVINLYDILEASNGQLFGEPVAHIFTGFCFDSRRAVESQLYVALKTERGDTHQYMREAVEKGVTGILCTHPPDFDTQNVSVVLVRDTEAALLNWTRYVLQRQGTQVICVSGSTGKSMTLEAITRVLASQYRVHRSDGEVTGRLALPATLSGLQADHQFVVLELDITRPGEMADIAQTVQPDVVAIPALGETYMDTFASLDEIVAENRLLLDRLAPTSLAVLNYDEEPLRSLTVATRAQTLTIGVESFGADLIAYNVLSSADKTGFDLRFRGERYVGRWVPWLGKHQLYSALIGLAVGLHYDVELDNALRVLSDIPYMSGRMRPLAGLQNALVIDDTYAANLQSVLAALDWLQSVKQQMAEENHRAVFIMGDLDRLGEHSSVAHRTVGQRAAQVADCLVTQGIEASLAGRAALDQGMNQRNVYTTYSAQDTIAAVIDRIKLEPQDIALVVGGPSARMELVVSALLQDEKDRVDIQHRREFGEVSILAQNVRLSWVEVDLDALAQNVRGLKDRIGEQVTLMAVVKADAYGHGAVAAARTALLNGAEWLGVSSINEGLELRESGLDVPILLLNYVPVSAIQQALRHRLTVTLYDLDMARQYDRAAREIGLKLDVHVKVDTGMGRLGAMPKDAMILFRHMMTLRYLNAEGIYTHFAAADEDQEFTAAQAKIFRDMIVKPLRASGFNFRHIHAANSAATLSGKDYHFNMVRVGLAMYGLSPSQQVPVPENFRPVMSWKTIIAQVKSLPQGHTVGYGRAYVTKGEEKIAIIPVGYADGFRRGPHNWGEVLVHGQRAPLAGRVSMEKSAINVTHISGVSVGDEVVLLGRQGDQTITAEEVANRVGTNNYEIITGILPRVSRR